MMYCPRCRKRTGVFKTVVNEEGEVRRHRQCPGCQYRYATIEMLDRDNPLREWKRASEKPPKPKRQRGRPRSAKHHKNVPVRKFEEEIRVPDEPEEDLSAYIDLPSRHDFE